MNIFVLDTDIEKCAQALCDKHVVKMVLETAQLLSTAITKFDVTVPACAYKATHINHPCTKWAYESEANFNWLRTLGLAIGDEYRHRYGKVHKSTAVISAMPHFDTDKSITKFAQAMPNEYKRMDAVRAYREYYTKDKLLSIEVSYYERMPPLWLLDAVDWELDLNNRWKPCLVQ